MAAGPHLAAYRKSHSAHRLDGFSRRMVTKCIWSVAKWTGRIGPAHCRAVGRKNEFWGSNNWGFAEEKGTSKLAEFWRQKGRPQFEWPGKIKERRREELCSKGW